MCKNKIHDCSGELNGHGPLIYIVSTKYEILKEQTTERVYKTLCSS